MRWGTLAAIALVVAACTAGPASAAPLVTTDPPLQPRFRPAITDYGVRCPERSMTFGGRGYDGPESVAIEPGQAVAFRALRKGDTTRHFVRCVPDDFPTWTFRSVGTQTPRWYVLTPGINFDVTRTKRFVVIFDQNGAPVWWFRSPERLVQDARLIHGKIAYADAPPGGIFGSVPTDAYRIRRPDGALVRSLQAVGVPTDFHDFRPIGRGHLMLAYRPRPHVDLSAYGGPSDATVLDSEIQRVSHRDRLVWSWNSADHIPLAETGRWWPEVVGRPFTLPDGTTVYDITHINSIELVGDDDIILSLRNTDAVYRIAMKSGRIRWKLGGTETGRSLRVVGDPLDYPLGGQHDARVWKDGSVTISDNGTGLNRLPRAVRYAIDAKRRTATLQESISDPRVGPSLCCGSARKLANGDWLIGWGGNGLSSLLTPHGQLVSSLSFDDVFSYRTVPFPASAVARSDLREGMDAMYAAGEAD